MKIRAILFSLALALSLTVHSALAQADTFRVGVNAPVDLNPFTGSNDPEIMFNRMIYDYLLDLTPDSNLVNELAQSYAISDDGLTYTFTLRDGVTFHDGSPFSAADVVFSFQQLQTVGSPALNLLGQYEVSGSGLEVTFKLARPNADFLYGVASNWSFIIKDGTTTPNVLGEGTTAFANFVGTGAYVLTDYQPGQSATFTANPSYWDDQPSVTTIQHIYIEDQQAQVDALKSGAVDFIFKLAFDRVAELEDAGLNVLVRPTNQHPVIRLRADAGSLGEDVRVRQAFKLATDRELLNQNLFSGLASVGNNDPIGPLYGPFFSDDVPTQDFDPARACELLAEAGYPDGLGADEPIPFYVVNALNYVRMAEFLQQDWAQGCINVAILPRSEGEYYAGDAETAEWLNVQLGVTGWGSRPVPQQYLVEAYVTGASFNESHWSDPELDELVAQAGVTSDQAERAAIYKQIATIFAERGPIIVPFFAPMVGATSPRVQSLDIHPFPGRTDLRSVVLNS
ncbi:MAG: ABC transporter substrate-binding protein [Anaerolineae bacterium]|nr:ABC transporter substrate-binding protein [Anaerolineae bacterium]